MAGSVAGSGFESMAGSGSGTGTGSGVAVALALGATLALALEGALGVSLKPPPTRTAPTFGAMGAMGGGRFFGAALETVLISLTSGVLDCFGGETVLLGLGSGVAGGV